MRIPLQEEHRQLKQLTFREMATSAWHQPLTTMPTQETAEVLPIVHPMAINVAEASVSLAVTCAGDLATRLLELLVEHTTFVPPAPVAATVFALLA